MIRVMSQSKLTDIEIDTFARYLWEHGDKRKLEAFRATFPNSKTADRSASANAGRIYEREKANILLTIQKLQKLHTEDSNTLGIDITERQKLYAAAIGRATTAVSDEGKSDDGIDVDRALRTALVACDQLNKLDGSYAPIKAEIDADIKDNRPDLSELSMAELKSLAAMGRQDVASSH